MDLIELKKSISNGEDGQNQFKEDFMNIDSIASEMVAFSNSRGGRIFIGVSNLGELVGLSKADVNRLNQLISNAASQHVRGPIVVQSENIYVGSNRVVIVLSIQEGIDKPYFDHQGVIWLKSGADKRRVNSKEELRRLFQEVDLIHADEVPTSASPKVLNEKLLGDFLEKFYREKLPKSQLKRLQLLEHMSLATKGCLNLAGLLLFSEKPQLFKPQFIIKAVCFPGNTIANRYLDSEDFEGPLPIIFQGALAFIMRNLRKVQGNKGVNSLGEPEIPQGVFEELLVNALIHRDYFISAPVRLFVFDDRVEIISPGNLPNHLTIEKIQAGNSVQRNPILASFIAKGLLPYRGLGTGIRRALEHWPKIRFSDDREGCLFTSVVERIKVVTRLNGPINGLINGPIKMSLSKVHEYLLTMIQNDPKIAYEGLAEKLNKSRNFVKRNIQQLKALGLLRRLGSNKKGHWEIVKSSEQTSINDSIKEPINGSVNGPIKLPLSKAHEHLLTMIQNDPTIAYESLAEKLNKSRNFVKRNIRQLKELGLLRRLGSNKKGHWEIVLETTSVEKESTSEKQ